MHRILFVCHGNICRSPMAEFVLKDMVKRRGIAKDFFIASAATSTDDIGAPVYRRTRDILAPLGISVAGKTAVQMTAADYAQYDHLLGMDSYNVQNMRRIAGGDPDGKIRLLLDFTDTPRDIADPWYTGDFEATYADVAAGCEGLLRHILGG